MEGSPMNAKLAALGALLLVPCAGAVFAAPVPTPPLTWVFDTHQDKELVPHSKVYLRVGTMRVLIEPKADCEFHPVSRADYKTYKVPAPALTACSGWFGGGGEDLYVVRRKDRLLVYRRWTDEQAPEFPYKRIRTIPLPGR